MPLSADEESAGDSREEIAEPSAGSIAKVAQEEGEWPYTPTRDFYRQMLRSMSKHRCITIGATGAQETRSGQTEGQSK